MRRLWLRLVRHGTEKPDYELIARLEAEFGVGKTPDEIETQITESFIRTAGRLPTQKEQSAVSLLVGTAYQRLIDRCTIEPGKKWYD